MCDELECTICRSPYVTPVTIQCGHTYCCSCLHTYWSGKASAAQLCPLCRAPHSGAWAVNTWAERLTQAAVPEEYERCSNEVVLHPERRRTDAARVTKAEYLDRVVLARDVNDRREAALCARLDKFYRLYTKLDMSDAKQLFELLCCAAAVLTLFKTSGDASAATLGEEARFLKALWSFSV